MEDNRVKKLWTGIIRFNLWQQQVCMVHDVEGRVKVIVAHTDQLEHDILGQNNGGNDGTQSGLGKTNTWEQQFSK